jgi:hypothetical protein
VSEAEIDEAIAKFKTKILDEQGKIDILQLGIDITDEEFALAKEVIEENIQEIDTKIDIAVKTGDLDAALDLIDQKNEQLRQGAIAAFGKIGINFDEELEDLTADELRDFIASLGDVELPPGVRESLNDFIDGLEEGLETTIAITDQEIALLNAKKESGEFTKEEEAAFQDEILAKLEEQRDAILEQIELGDDSIETELKLFDILGKINDLKEEGNEIDEESNELLAKAVRERQKLLEAIREESRGGTLTAEQQQQISQSEQEIIAQLRAGGASEDEIAAFLRTLPAFQEGGVVPRTGLALVTEGEPIFTVMQAEALQTALDKMAADMANMAPIVAGTDSLTQEVSRIIFEKERISNRNTQIVVNLGDTVINTLPGQNIDPVAVGKKIGNENARVILDTVQRAIDANQIDIRGKV